MLNGRSFLDKRRQIPFMFLSRRSYSGNRLGFQKRDFVIGGTR
jgi:hypothetical protein